MKYEYRLVKDFDENLAIYEACLDDNENVLSITEEPILPFGAEVEDITNVLAEMSKALTKPILELSQFSFRLKPEHCSKLT